MTPAIRPGLVSVTFRHRSATDVVALAAGAGLAAVEWGGDVHVPHGDLETAATVKRLCDEAGLAVSAYGSYYRAGGRANPDWTGVLDTAAALGTTVVRVWPGTAGSADTPDRRPVVDDLALCCDAAAERGLAVATEFDGGTLTDTAESAVALLTAVDRPNLRTLWQPPHGMAAAAALSGLAAVSGWMADVHVFHWWPDADHRRPLADGADRWPAYLAVAAAAGAAFASLEFVPGDDVDQFRRDAATLIGWVAGVRSATPDGE